ncbi:MAG: VWA domain-containing protein [Anaerolineae bacterium]|nr:VWA domain-containing protein [Anaerolineae bacterium]
MSQNRSTRQSSVSGVILILLLLIAFVLVACFVLVGALANTFQDLFPGPAAGPTVAGAPAAQTVLRVAYSPEKADLFTQLVDNFNGLGLTAQDGAPLRVDAIPMEPSAMIEAARAGEIDALSPDSSLWLGELDRAWGEYVGDESALVVGQTVRYAVSPLVFVMWRDVAHELGWPGKPIRWVDVMNRAQADSDFAWSHASTSTTSGLLATLAEFYAGANKTRDLSIEDVQAQSTLDYVAAIERTVRFYGQGEADVARQIDEQMAQSGTRYLDAFVGQEQLVVDLNRKGHDVVAVYPAEGALWSDHPLALLENGTLSDVQRLTFQRFTTYVAGSEAQALVLNAGYRPADLEIDLTTGNSPFVGTDIVDPTQPRTGLQMPGAQVIDVVRDVWWYTKRPTDVYLVVDSSGSMDGEKIERMKDALFAFLDGIRGSRDRVGLVEFYDQPSLAVRMDNVTPAFRETLRRAFGELRAGGETALLDAVREAFVRLQEEGDRDHINAIVVMTDGVENASFISLRDLTALLAQESRVPVVVFAVAYGDDADYNMLEAIVSSTGGRVWEGDVETIRNLYRIISTYF